MPDSRRVFKQKISTCHRVLLLSESTVNALYKTEITPQT